MWESIEIERKFVRYIVHGGSDMVNGFHRRAPYNLRRSIITPPCKKAISASRLDEHETIAWLGGAWL
jgi:hypothetical protein